MYPHQIRLAEPWDRIAGTPMRMRRRFGRPRQLDEWERVWLIPANTSVENIGTWRLNDVELEWSRRGDGYCRSDVTRMLRERNEVVVEWETTEFGGAILEIGCRAFVQHIEAGLDANGRLTVSTDVFSESADDPLELYVLIDGETYGYFGPFSTNGMLTHEFRLDEYQRKSESGVTLRVDLICRSTIWDTLEMTVEIPANQRETTS